LLRELNRNDNLLPEPHLPHTTTPETTMEYAKTKDILHIMKALGHRNIQNTLLYTQLVNFKSDEFHSTTAKTVQEAQKLVEA
jgi:hypothetical protein